ncbi:aldehyde dehydrogenase family protein [Minwuia thermotolerans]|uniref:Aldehyde dehydrogenase n=1 Tax=Minwuia thermotolerans TaxID=2056226 RepID=A0A2M9G2R7_9PROT|nr:aldehyde dehydrogenase family protein [Minwuia thermotolerans]PJK29998.1 aldehyde dehydrogenase [Minwuia thermotolerans]
MSAELPHIPLLVPGIESSATSVTVSAPWDLTPIATVARADSATVEKALANAYALYRNRDAWLPMRERVQILTRAMGIMRERREKMATDAAREGGKPLADSLIEVDRAIDSVHICIDELRSRAGEVIPMCITESSKNRVAFTRPEPVGVVVAVSAFNHPLNLIAHQVAPAVATGCPVIVKPADKTALSCLSFVQILREAGLPPEWCQAVVTADRKDATAMVTDERVGFFSFIGSAKVGWTLRSQLAPGTRCALEHGGAAPVIVTEGADLDRAVPSLAKGGFYHAGQVCVSVQRVFTPKAMAREFATRLADAAKKMKVGDPTLADTEIGPLITPGEVDRVHQWVEEAKAAGAEVLCGGEKLTDTAYKPTVLLNPPADAKVSVQEIFGPVVCVYGYDDMDEAIDRANSLPFSFQAAVFGQDIDKLMRVSSRLDASAVMVNDHTAFRVDWMPFAGLKQSGHGVGGVPHSMHEMQIQKMTVIHSPEIKD